MRRLLLGIATLVAVAGFSDAAFADWTVVRATGTTWIVAPDSTARTPLAGEIVPDAWMVATGPDGRVLLMRGTETITISPSTQLVLTEHGQSTQVFQPTGTAEFDVEVRTFRHFVVETPVLAAVVKGTRFIVSVEGIHGSVRVERGAVEVKDNGTQEVALVATGQEAFVVAGTNNFEVRGEPPVTEPVRQAEAEPRRVAEEVVPAATELAATDPPPAPAEAGDTGNGGGNGNNNGVGNGTGNGHPWWWWLHYYGGGSSSGSGSGSGSGSDSGGSSSSSSSSSS